MHDNPATQKHFQLQQLYFWTPKISFNKIIKLHANLFPVMCANSVLPLSVVQRRGPIVYVKSTQTLLP